MLSKLLGEQRYLSFSKVHMVELFAIRKCPISFTSSIPLLSAPKLPSYFSSFVVSDKRPTLPPNLDDDQLFHKEMERAFSYGPGRRKTLTLTRESEDNVPIKLFKFMYLYLWVCNFAVRTFRQIVWAKWCQESCCCCITFVLEQPVCFEYSCLHFFQSKIGSATQEIKLTNGRYQQTLGKAKLFVRFRTKKQNTDGLRSYQRQPFLSDREQEYFFQIMVSSKFANNIALWWSLFAVFSMQATQRCA